MGQALHILSLLAALGAGLMAGLFFAFSAVVMPALARLPAAQGIAAMQSINLTVVNPWFGLVFFGTAALCVVLLAAAGLRGQTPRLAWLLAGAVFYLVGTLAVTVAFNVPLNNALAAVQPASTAAASLWSGYVPAWTAWNHLRTATALLACAAFIVARRQAGMPPHARAGRDRRVFRL